MLIHKAEIQGCPPFTTPTGTGHGEIMGIIKGQCFPLPTLLDNTTDTLCDSIKTTE